MNNKERLAFFLNLHNFAILCGLCKIPLAQLPKNELNWKIFANKCKIKVGEFVLSALEIKNIILRAFISIPEGYIEHTRIKYPSFNLGDPRRNLMFNEYIPLVNFGLYYPYKSSPPLMIYTSSHVIEELETIAGKFLFASKFKEEKEFISLPGIFKIYEDDFIKDPDNFIDLINQIIPSEYVAQYEDLESLLYIFSLK